MLTASCVLCVSDFWHKRSYWQLNNNNKNNNGKQDYSITKLSYLPALPKRIKKGESNKNAVLPMKEKYKYLYIKINAVAAFYLIREILECSAYRERMLKYLPNQLDVLWLQITPARKHIIDFKWNNMVSHSLWEHIEIDILMSWLSTLGGGFSALGEQFSNCAETAGKISMKQLSIGLRIGDPFLQARCKLYYALSLIQTGRLRTAKYIVRDQYRLAIRHREQDGRLVKMCLGIWLRIVYEYKLKHERISAGGDAKKNSQ